MTVTIASDVILVNSKDEILLVRRSPTSNAYPNYWALPGGKMEINETTVQCAIRELKEETGYDILIPFPKSARIFDRVDRDPRGRTISVVFFGIIFSGTLKAGDDASDAEWFPKNYIKEMPLAFDHNKIIAEMI